MRRLSRSTAHLMPNVKVLALALAFWRLQVNRAEQQVLKLEERSGT